MFNKDAAYELFDVLVDMLEEFEYDTECHEKTGIECGFQRVIIERAKEAIELANPGYLERKNGSV